MHAACDITTTPWIPSLNTAMVGGLGEVQLGTAAVKAEPSRVTAGQAGLRPVAAVEFRGGMNKAGPPVGGWLAARSHTHRHWAQLQAGMGRGEQRRSEKLDTTPGLD